MTISVDVQTKVYGSEKEAQILKNILISKLKRENWKVVERGGLNLLIVITHLKRVGGLKRFVMGFLVGRASVKAEVTLKDINDNLITQFSVSGESAPFEIIPLITIPFTTTRQALKKAAKQILNSLRDETQGKGLKDLALQSLKNIKSETQHYTFRK
ncbi:MAG: hypothetical protein AB1606_01635 [Nitrospirota bacterium]